MQNGVTFSDAFDEGNMEANITLLTGLTFQEKFPGLDGLLSALGGYAGFSGLAYYNDYQDDPQVGEDVTVLVDGDAQGTLELAYHEVTSALEKLLQDIDSYFIAAKDDPEERAILG